MRFLLVVFPEPGHLHPFIGIAQHLVAAGHSVAVFSQVDLRDRLAAAGVDCPVFFSSAALPRGERELRSYELAQRLKRRGWASRWYAYVLLATVNAQVDELRRVIRTWAPDVLCGDAMAYSAPIVGELEGIPWASVSTMLVPLAPRGFGCLFLDLLQQQAAAREELFAAHGVRARFKYGDVISPWLNTVFTTEELVPRALADNDFSHYIGPSVPRMNRGDEPEFPWHRLTDGRPLVYVSFGSQLSPTTQVIEHLAHAVPDADLVLALNDLDGDATLVLPSHAIRVRYAPQLALLERASVMVSHGGANSVAECLRCGVPLLVIPLAHDQPLQAHLVEQSGAGAALSDDDVTPARLHERLAPLLSPDHPARRRARAIGESFRDHDGAKRAAELLVELGRTRQPHLPEHVDVG